MSRPVYTILRTLTRITSRSAIGTSYIRKKYLWFIYCAVVMFIIFIVCIIVSSSILFSLRAFLLATSCLPPHYLLSTSSLPPLYLLSTSSLPPHYLLSTSSLPPLYLLTTSSLPPLYLLSTSSLPRLYLLSTSSLPPHYLLATSSLPPHYLLTTSSLPPLYLLSTSSLPPLYLLSTSSLPPLYLLSTSSLPPRYLLATSSLPPYTPSIHPYTSAVFLNARIWRLLVAFGVRLVTLNSFVIVEFHNSILCRNRLSGLNCNFSSLTFFAAPLALSVSFVCKSLRYFCIPRSASVRELQKLQLHFYINIYLSDFVFISLNMIFVLLRIVDRLQLSLQLRCR